MKHNLKLLVFIFCIYSSTNLFANKLVPYKAPAFFGEARLTKEYLGSLECTVGGGGSEQGFNSYGQKTNALNIFGAENFRNIAEGVPATILALNPGAIIDDLWETSLPGFGTIELQGKFKLTEINFNFLQNFKHGFFTELNLPIRKIGIKDFRYNNLATSDLAGSASFSQWQNFTANLVTNLAKYNIHLQNYQDFSLGDIQLAVGWTQTNLTNNKYLDFWDTTVKAGIIIPTAPGTNPNYPLLISSGYDHNIGFPFSFDLSAGLFEWITIGTHLEGVLFTDKYQTISMKTALQQNGLIKLASGTARIEKGNIWQIGSFIKSDHMPWGLSITLAYSFSTQQKTVLNLPDTSSFDCNIVNSDRLLTGWSMHTINTSIEYDFAVEKDKAKLPHLRLNFDIPLAGKHVFKNTIFSGTIGIDFVW